MRRTPAFTTPLPTLRLRHQFNQLHRCSRLSPVTLYPKPVTKSRRPVRMMGPFFPDLGNSNLMKSEIVRKEMGSLERDYMQLSQLGTRYEVS